MSEVAALVMGRAGSVGVPGKNIRMVAGHPLVWYPIQAALKARLVDKVYVTTDCPVIAEIAVKAGAIFIERPAELAQADSEMSDAIVHALSHMFPSPAIVVSMHANCGIHREGLVDECVQRLFDDSSLDSCVSARVEQNCHPYRLKKVLPDGTLSNWVAVPDSVANNRQAIKERAVALEGACRAWRPYRCLPPRGQPPFRYLGRRIGWVENPDGLDIHDEIDVTITERWHRDHHMNESPHYLAALGLIP